MTRLGHTSRTHRPARSAATLLLALASAACGGEGDRSAASSGKEQAAAPSCSQADTTPVALAVREFIAKAEPTPQRFLNAAGTDSSLPDDGFKVLQDKGPTYYYTGDSAARATVRARLADVGPYTSLLVVYRGKTESEGGNAVDVRLAGHYVGGDHEGKSLPTKRYGVRCDSTGWRIASTTDEP